MARFLFFSSVNTVSAFLTGFEIVLGTIATLCLGPFLQGLWLVRLHVKGETTLKRSQLKSRLLRREIIAFILAAWFALASALVQSPLSSILLISEEIVTSPTCIRLDTNLDSLRRTFTLPSRFQVDDWSNSVAQELSCEYGLNTIDLGNNGGRLEETGSTQAPVCNLNKSKLNSSFSHVPSTILFSGLIEFLPFYLNITEFPLFQVFHHDTDVGKSGSISNGFNTENYSTIEYCLDKKLLSFPINTIGYWQISRVDYANISRGVFSHICNGIDIENKVPVRSTILKSCWNTQLATPAVDVKCLRDGTQIQSQYSVILSNISILSIGYFYPGRKTSFICPDDQIRLKFSLVQKQSITDLYHETCQLSPDVALCKSYNSSSEADNIISVMENGPEEHVLLPTQIDILSENCETTLFDLGLAAMVHSANVEWMGTNANGQNRKTRYYAHMISLARLIYSTDILQGNIENPTDADLNTECQLRMVKSATVINIDWYFGNLILIYIACSLFFIICIIFWLIFPLIAWKISPLERLQRNDPIPRSFAKGDRIIVGRRDIASISKNASVKQITTDNNSTPDSWDPMIKVEVLKNFEREEELFKRTCVPKINQPAYRISLT